VSGALLHIYPRSARASFHSYVREFISREHTIALAERVGGSDPARMQVQVSVGHRPAFARTHAAGETYRFDEGKV